MLLTKKIHKLQKDIQIMQKLSELYPDIEVSDQRWHVINYYYSPTINVSATNVEFLTEDDILFCEKNIALYKDVKFEINNILHSIRVYGHPDKIKIYEKFMGILKGCPYDSILTKLEVNPIVIRKIHIHVFNYIKANKPKIDKDTFHPTVLKLLNFL